MDNNETETEQDITYKDASGLRRGLMVGIPLALVVWAVIFGAIWALSTVI